MMNDEKKMMRTELHCRTNMSGLSGMCLVSELAGVSDTKSIKGLAITDFNSVQSFPAGKRYFKDSDVKPLYGAEVTVDQYGRKTTCMLIARNEEGRINLFRIITAVYSGGAKAQPKTTKKIIENYRKGLLVGASCEGEIMEASMTGKKDDFIADLVDFYDYIEVQPVVNMKPEEALNPEKQIMSIIRIAKDKNKPVVAVSNAHFINKEDSEYYKLLVLCNKGEKSVWENLYLRSIDEMLEEFAFLGGELAREIVIDNPDKINNMCERIYPLSQKRIEPDIPDSSEEIKKLCMTRAKEIYGETLPATVEERLNDELDNITRYGYERYYLLMKKIADRSVEMKYPVFSRGSVGASFVSFLLGITEVNPLLAHYFCPGHCYEEEESYNACGCDLLDKVCPVCGKKLKKDGFNIPFEIFAGIKKNRIPDIDLNIGVTVRDDVIDYLKEIFGEKNVIRVGTVAGFHDFYDEKYEKLCAVKRNMCIHPGGIIIVPEDEDINEITPVQYVLDSNGQEHIATHLLYRDIDENIEKHDLLSHYVPDILHDLAEETGYAADSIPLDDREIIRLIRDGEPYGRLGICEFDTKYADEICDITKPDTVGDLIRILGVYLGNDTWEDNADKLISGNKAGLSEVICCRDEIFLFLMDKGIAREEAFKIMENARKGKGLTVDMEKLLRETEEIPEWYIDSCNKIRYLVPKAHAAGYVIQALKMAYYKIHYPLEFYRAIIKYRSGGYIPEAYDGSPEMLKELITKYEKDVEDWRKSSVETCEAEKTLNNLYVLMEASKRGIKPTGILDGLDMLWD